MPPMWRVRPTASTAGAADGHAPGHEPRTRTARPRAVSWPPEKDISVPATLYALKPRFQALLRPLVGRLAAAGIT
ncbi:MAG: hypothetical protein AB7P02_29595, partial [Alphaproteobacteria bacterium]